MHSFCVSERTSAWLRIKQHLELPGQKYDYIKTFVTNVKGLDKDIEFMGTTFNFAKMHMYMHSTGFENFFGNMQVTIMEQLGMLDTTDAAAVQAVFQSIDDAVETINVSFVMTRAK